MGRTKMLIAVGALTLGLFGGTAWLATVEAQAPGPVGLPGSGPALPPPSGVLPPAASATGPVSAPAAKVPQVEYKALQSPSTDEEVTLLLNKQQGEGWEYLNEVTLKRGGQTSYALVFKKVAPKLAGMAGGGGMIPGIPGSGSIPSGAAPTGPGAPGGMLPPKTTGEGPPKVETIQLKYGDAKLVVASILTFFPECQANAISSKSFVLKCQTTADEKSVMKLIQEDHPHMGVDCQLSRAELNQYRQKYLETFFPKDASQMHEFENLVLDKLKAREVISNKSLAQEVDNSTYGERLSDKIAAFGGSWTFIISFGSFLLLWILINVLMGSKGFDVYPFIFLNLILSTIAALQAPVIIWSDL